MTHKDLVDIGFRLCGEEEDDPYYHLTYRPPFNFGIQTLSGVLENNEFWLYGNDKRYTDKNELLKIINVLGNQIYKF
jgi:hypothetical protein